MYYLLTSINFVFENDTHSDIITKKIQTWEHDAVGNQAFTYLSTADRHSVKSRWHSETTFLYIFIGVLAV